MQQDIQNVNNRSITKIVLDGPEWINFIAAIRSKLVQEVGVEQADKQIAIIKENQCIPLLPANSSPMQVKTTVVGVLTGEYGELYYRAWWAENGGAPGTAKVSTELGDVNTIFNEFKEWFKKLPFGSSIVSTFAVNKQSDHFDVSTVRAWIALKHGLDLNSGAAIRIVRMKSWVWSAELSALWYHSSLIKSDKTGLTF